MSHASTKTRSDAQITSLTEKELFGSQEQPKANNEFARQAQTFVSFDGGERASGYLQCPDRYRFWSPAHVESSIISRGAGLSYCGASFGDQVSSIDHGYFNRILEFDPAGKTIRVEAGISLGDLYEFLIGHGLFLATQPGHPRITIGGCIAADIHGKNQFRDGTFINQLIDITLFHPSHGLLTLSPSKEPDLFRLTCGGYGLTGNIISANLRLTAVPSAMAEVKFVPVNDVNQLPAQIRESAKHADFVFSWHDFNARGGNFGQGFIQEGRFVNDQTPSQLKLSAGKQTLSADNRGVLPFSLYNRASLTLLNTLYGAKARGAKTSFTMTLFDSIFPIQNAKELYFKFFGKGGFFEYQMLLPAESFSLVVGEIKQWLQHSNLPVTLASAKLFSGKQDLLRFTGAGICLALNVPRSDEAIRFMSFLDEVIIRHEGIPNIIKDSRLPPNVVRSTYREFESFKERLHDFDPQRLYRSSLSERLRI